jgi:hypothetical protein
MTAENGSQFGELALRSGKEKRVYVPPFFSATGVRVRGHYRTEPLPVIADTFDLGDSHFLFDVQRANGKAPAFFVLGREDDARLQSWSVARIERLPSVESASLRPIASRLPKSSTSTKDLVASIYSPSVRVAENGSVFGEISDLTGRPKTVYVNGYYRKDGTYVRGHFRSPPSAKSLALSPEPVEKTPPPRTGVAENGTRYGEISAATGRPKTVFVNSYYRSDGTYVRSHYRSSGRRK